MKRKYLLFSFSLRKILSAASLICCLNTQAQTWGLPVPAENIQVTGYATGQYNSLRVVNGNPAVSFCDVANGALVYIRSTDVSGTTWSTPTLIDTVGYTGLYTSLQIVNGNPAISYYDFTTNDLKYVRALDASGLTWGQPISIDVAGDVGAFSSMVIVNGNPAISYHDYTNQDLKYVRANDASGISWGTPVSIDVPGNVGQYTSMQIVNGNPAISYNDNTNTGVKYISAIDPSGLSWNTPVPVVATGTVGMHTSLQVVNGNPAISYFDAAAQGHLMYIRATTASGTSWGTPVTIDQSIHTGAYSSLEIVNGNPAVAYYDQSSQDLKYARSNDALGTLWGNPFALDGNFANVGSFASMQIVNGNPAVAYYESYYGTLKYTRAANPSGTAWPASQTINAYTGPLGKYPSLQVISGNPAISYYDQSNNALKYVRATNPSGSGWGVPYTIQTYGYYGLNISLLDLNGNPAISYNSFLSGLMFVRGLNASGSGWNASATVDAAGGSYPSLQLVNGNPAISYCTSTTFDLHYVRASNSSGSAWGTPIPVATTGSVGLYTSMQIVNGNPAISYYDLSNKNLKYVRALDTDGNTWGTPISVDLNVNVNEGLFTSLQVINGNPAIAYFDITNKDLKYIRSTDALGTTWGTPLSIDANGDVGRNPSLHLVNGNPAISYYDLTNHNLKYIRAYDPSGANWASPVSLDTLGLTGEFPSMIPVGMGVGVAYYNATIGRPYFILGEGCDNNAGHSVNGEISTAFQPGATYQWLDCANGSAAIPGATAQTFTTSAPGNYAVIVTQNGCSDTSACMYSYPTVGISELTGAKKLRIYPNPNDGTFLIESSAEGNYLLVDPLGKTVASFILNEYTNYSVKLENLSRGVYFIRDTKQNTHQKVVIDR